MTDESFTELLDLAAERMDRTGTLDVSAFVGEYPDAAGEVEEFLRTMGAWLNENRRSEERIRAGVLAALPAVVERARSLTLGDLFAGMDLHQASAFGLRPMILRRLQGDQTLLLDLATPEQLKGKARELRVDEQMFTALLRQLVDTVQAVDVPFAARHEEDPTEED